ncbi:dolichol monophosphate mannose synthase, partial [Candidatus Roizmanbacteria bacterium CG09_land_8_20_14_0_10_41_9]
MIGISVVVPTLNEKSNLKPLIERIGGSLKIAGFDYEIIIVDDHSTDSSNLVIQSLTKKFPIRFYTKRGLKGKAQSLIEGFSYAKYPLIAMIDADLQYPPEAIPKMIE